jgi:branched-chain amino acid transport system substrate-binding protein
MIPRKFAPLLATVALGISLSVRADVTIGVSIPLTGPGVSLGLPTKNAFELWPESIAGVKIKLIILDDASDPTAGILNARKFVEQEKADLIIASAITPPALAIATVATENRIVQISPSPLDLPPEQGDWTFRIAQNVPVVATGAVEHMQKAGVKTLAFLGYNDPYGETWLKATTAAAEKAGIKLVAVERFARADTSVTAQAIKVTVSKADAVLIVATGSGAVTPHKAVLEKGYKGRIYHTHGAVSADMLRLGGKDVEGAYAVSGFIPVAEQLPASHPSRKLAMRFIEQYEKKFGAGSRNQFAAHINDILILLENALPLALKQAAPGTKEFRIALRTALESIGDTTVSQGQIAFSRTGHTGLDNRSVVMLKIQNGAWILLPN